MIIAPIRHLSVQKRPVTTGLLIAASAWYSSLICYSLSKPFPDWYNVFSVPCTLRGGCLSGGSIPDTSLLKQMIKPPTSDAVTQCFQTVQITTCGSNIGV